MNTIDQRFYQPSFDTYAKMESVSLNSKTFNSQNKSEKLNFIEKLYNDDFNISMLTAQMEILQVLLKSGDYSCLDDIIVKIKLSVLLLKWSSLPLNQIHRARVHIDLLLRTLLFLFVSRLTTDEFLLALVGGRPVITSLKSHVFFQGKEKQKYRICIILNNSGRIWRILQISEGVIHLGLRPLWITPSLICRILHILLSLIQ